VIAQNAAAARTIAHSLKKLKSHMARQLVVLKNCIHIVRQRRIKATMPIAITYRYSRFHFLIGNIIRVRWLQGKVPFAMN